MIAEMKRPAYKRKQYLVAKKFQLKYVGLILLLMFLTAAMCSYVVYYTAMILMGEKLANVYPQGRLISIVKSVNFRILLSVIFITPFVAVIGIFLSHRIAGPIFRMEKFLYDMASGNLASRITLRQNDELTTLANGINNLAESMSSSISVQKALVNSISDNIANIKKAIDSKSHDISGIAGAVNRVDNEIKVISKELEKYKV